MTPKRWDLRSKLGSKRWCQMFFFFFLNRNRSSNKKIGSFDQELLFTKWIQVLCWFILWIKPTRNMWVLSGQNGEELWKLKPFRFVRRAVRLWGRVTQGYMQGFDVLWCNKGMEQNPDLLFKSTLVLVIPAQHLKSQKPSLFASIFDQITQILASKPCPSCL